MTLEGSLSASVEAAGGTVQFALAVTNTGDDSVELAFRDAGRADFAVYAGNEEVWRFSDGRMFAQVIGTETLAPGERATYGGEWSDPEPGEYVAVATLRAREHEVEARTEFVV